MSAGVRSAFILLPALAGSGLLLAAGPRMHFRWRRLVVAVSSAATLVLTVSVAGNVHDHQVVQQYLFSPLGGLDVTLSCDSTSLTVIILVQLLALVALVDGRLQNRETALLLAVSGTEIVALGSSVFVAMLGAQFVAGSILFSGPKRYRPPRSMLFAFALSQAGVSCVFLTMVQLQAQFGTAAYTDLSAAAMSPGVTAAWIAAMSLLALAPLFIAPRFAVSPIATVGGISSGILLGLRLLQSAGSIDFNVQLAWASLALAALVVIGAGVFLNRRRDGAVWQQISVFLLLLGFSGMADIGNAPLALAAALLSLYVAEFAVVGLARKSMLGVAALPLGFGSATAVISASSWLHGGGWMAAAGTAMLLACGLVSLATTQSLLQWLPRPRVAPVAGVAALVATVAAIVCGLLETGVAAPLAGSAAGSVDAFSVGTALGVLPLGWWVAAAVAAALTAVSVLLLLGRPLPGRLLPAPPRQYSVMVAGARRMVAPWLFPAQRRYLDADNWMGLQPQLPLVFLIAGVAWLFLH